MPRTADLDSRSGSASQRTPDISESARLLVSPLNSQRRTFSFVCRKAASGRKPPQADASFRPDAAFPTYASGEINFGESASICYLGDGSSLIAA